MQVISICQKWRGRWFIERSQVLKDESKIVKSDSAVTVCVAGKHLRCDDMDSRQNIDIGKCIRYGDNAISVGIPAKHDILPTVRLSLNALERLHFPCSFDTQEK
jgi:hypothetical protein